MMTSYSLRASSR